MSRGFVALKMTEEMYSAIYRVDVPFEEGEISDAREAARQGALKGILGEERAASFEGSVRYSLSDEEKFRWRGNWYFAATVEVRLPKEYIQNNY